MRYRQRRSRRDFWLGLVATAGIVFLVYRLAVLAEPHRDMTPPAPMSCVACAPAMMTNHKLPASVLRHLRIHPYGAYRAYRVARFVLP